jgi:hypothetical protein
VYAISGPESEFSDDEYNKLSPAAHKWIDAAVAAVQKGDLIPGVLAPVEQLTSTPAKKKATKVDAPSASDNKAAAARKVKPRRKNLDSASFQVRKLICANLHLRLRDVRVEVKAKRIRLAVSEVNSIYYNVRKVVTALIAVGIDIPGGQREEEA